MSLRRFNSHLKALLHFDFPYYAEQGDGLGDDIGNFAWSRVGGAKLVGTDFPADEIVAGTPKFGYRCLHTSSPSQYIKGTINSAQSYSAVDISLWVRLKSNSNANLISLCDGDTNRLYIGGLTSGSLSLTLAGSGSLSTQQTLPLGQWCFIQVQVDTTHWAVYINGSLADQGDRSGAIGSFNNIRIGGADCYIDEFALRDQFSSTQLPTAPINAVCNINDFGGFGSGNRGNVTITVSGVLNSTALFKSSVGTTRIRLDDVRKGILGDFTKDDEVLLLGIRTGEYCIRKIASVDYTNPMYINLVDPYSTSLINENFPYIEGIQLIQVPTFNTLTVPAGVTLYTPIVDPWSGGVMAFKVKGNCTINGSLISVERGGDRTDSYQLSHSGLIDRFLPKGMGGGIFIFCGGTFTASSGARIGAPWSGAGKGGEPTTSGRGGNGGAGYGGGGGSDTDSYTLGGRGGVGGGGGGSDSQPRASYTGCDAGGNGRTGGDFTYESTKGYDNRKGGTQTTTAGAVGINGGGGGAGGVGTSRAGAKNSSGASVVLIANAISIDEAALSTGGQGGNAENNENEGGGGGTGFCYIATNRII